MGKVIFHKLKLQIKLIPPQPVILREIRRNSIADLFSADNTQTITDVRRKLLKRSKVDESLLNLVKEKLRLRWSLEQIAGWR